jgi:hypothetical protein
MKNINGNVLTRRFDCQVVTYENRTRLTSQLGFDGIYG